MAVDAPALAVALGLPEAEGTRLFPIAASLVDAYLRGATDCPDAIRDEAIIRTAGHVQSRRGYGVIEGRLKTSSLQIDLQPAARSAVRQSGAAALLAPWVNRTA